MIEEMSLDYLIQNGFAISVALYLLWERGKFNQRIASSLDEIAIVVKEVCKNRSGN
jgi:hypothetical protein